MEVPDIVTRPLGAVLELDTMLTPGAMISAHVPKLEKDARASLMSEAMTVIADGARAGDPLHAFLLSFPAATTTTIPLDVASATALSSDSAIPPPMDMLMTFRRGVF